MNTIYEPSVYLVGATQMKDAGVEDFLEAHKITTWVPGTGGHCSEGESVIEVGGRLCYMSFEKPRPGGNRAYIHHIKEVGHGSVLEHSTYNFIFTGISRTLTHELVRHRVGMSYSQLSQRYVDESVAEYVVPHDLKEEVKAAVSQEALVDKNPDDQLKMIEAGRAWLAAVSLCHASYIQLTDYLFNKIKSQAVGEVNTQEQRTAMRKVARQAARSVLPNATETKIMVTANTRSLRHFIELRASRHAEPEIRKLAHAVWRELIAHSPNSFGDYTETLLSDGTYELTTPYKKV